MMTRRHQENAGNQNNAALLYDGDYAINFNGSRLWVTLRLFEVENKVAAIIDDRGQTAELMGLSTRIKESLSDDFHKHHSEVMVLSYYDAGDRGERFAILIVDEQGAKKGNYAWQPFANFDMGYDKLIKLLGDERIENEFTRIPRMTSV